MGRLRIDQKKRQRGATKVQTQLLVIIFFAAVSFGRLFFSEQSIESAYRLKDTIIEKATFNSPIPVLQYPYEGWQPAIHSDDDEECQSWRACFVKNHNCTSKCRDSLLDLGSPPPRPGFTPNPDLSDEENNENAQKVLWVPDVTVLRRMLKNGVDSNGNPWPPPLVTDQDRELCKEVGDAESDENKKAIEGIPVRAKPLLINPTDDAAYYQTTKMKRAPKIMCVVYSMETQHHILIRAARETWAPGCDGFLVFSTRDDPRIPAISIPHEGDEDYRNMWQKVRSILKFVGTHYLEDFDFFHVGGEDMHVLPQNLRYFLADQISDPTMEDYYGGRRFLHGGDGDDDVYNTGGPGYTLSQATLQKMVNRSLDEYWPHRRSSAEDVIVARGLRTIFGIRPVDTRDDQERERFHHFPPWELYKNPLNRRWYNKANILWPTKTGKDCCATDTAAFHRVRHPAQIRHLHSLLYFCADGQ